MSEVALDSVLLHLVKGIVDEPDNVQVDTRSTARGTTLEVRVDPNDLGRVIGRNGKTAQALRTVIGALARDERVRIDVIDTDGEH